MRHRVSGILASMSNHRIGLLELSIICMSGACQSPTNEEVVPGRIKEVVSATAQPILPIQDRDALLSFDISQRWADHFVEVWNHGTMNDSDTPRARYMVELLDSSGASRLFHVGTRNAREGNGPWFTMLDTTLVSGLDTLRSLANKWVGSYVTDNGGSLTLFRNGAYHHGFFQCTWGSSCEGTWQAHGDSLLLTASPLTASSFNAPYTSRPFEGLFIRQGQRLYATGYGDINYRFWFIKE